MPSKKAFTEELEKFKEFFNIVKGVKDVKSRVQVLADPDNLNTMSILKEGQARALANSEFLSSCSWGAMFDPLKSFNESIREPSIAVGGKGREQAIQFMGALSESKLLSKLGLTMKGDDKTS